MKKIISFILGSLFALNLTITAANSAANEVRVATLTSFAAEFAAVIVKFRANKLPKMKLIIFFISSPVN